MGGCGFRSPAFLEPHVNLGTLGRKVSDTRVKGVARLHWDEANAMAMGPVAYGYGLNIPKAYKPYTLNPKPKTLSHSPKPHEVAIVPLEPWGWQPWLWMSEGHKVSVLN